jgi:hypothetical protein
MRKIEKMKIEKLMQGLKIVQRWREGVGVR